MADRTASDPARPSAASPPSLDALAAAVRARAAARPPEAAPSPAVASVSLVLRPGPEDAELLYILRAERAGDPWSGHVAFPGGRREPSDPSVFHTAVRETLEEVGLDLNVHADYLAPLEDVSAFASRRGRSLVVSPHVFVVDPGASLATNHEVADAFWVPVRRLFEPARRGVLEVTHEGTTFSLPRIDLGLPGAERALWGLTLRATTMLFEAADLSLL